MGDADRTVTIGMYKDWTHASRQAASMIADALVEGKCSYCRGYKFLRGGYECPQCKGTGSDTPKFKHGTPFPNIAAYFNSNWQHTKADWMVEPIKRYNAPVLVFPSDMNPEIDLAASYVVSTGPGEIGTQPSINMHPGGLVCRFNTGKPSWVVILQ